MENKEKETYQLHGDRIPEDSAISSSIVPAEVSSSSRHGPGSALLAGAVPEVASVDESETKRKTLIEETTKGKETREEIRKQGKVEEEEKEIEKEESKEDRAKSEGTPYLQSYR